MDFHRLPVASWPHHEAGHGRLRGPPLTTRTPGPPAGLTPQDADTLQRAIHALGDYAHVSVRAGRRHLRIIVDDGNPIARCTPLGAGRYGLSFHSHAGRWEPLPIIADLTQLAQDLVGTLGPYLQRWDFPGTKSGSHH